MSELTVQEAALAWAQGKKVRATAVESGIGGLISTVGTRDGTWSADVFGKPYGTYTFRLAPVPPTKQWRPWTAEEVPVGALLRTKAGHFIHMIVAFNTAPKEVYAGQSWAGDVKYCLENAEHSLDNGKTWLPCGVEVTE